IDAFTLSDVWPTTTQISSEMGRALRKTCSISMRPPTWWRTFAYFDFMRVLLPAARIRIRRFSIDYSLASGEFGGRTRNSCYFRIRGLSPRPVRTLFQTCNLKYRLRKTIRVVADHPFLSEQIPF